jgi:hypothetical protein
VPSQFEAHVHPWPTRYHGPIYTRPVFGLPYVQSPYAVFKPGDFSATATAGLGVETTIPATCPGGCAPPGFLGQFKPGAVFIAGAAAGAATLWLVTSWFYERGKRS